MRSDPVASGVPEQRYLINGGDGTVTDTRTGLTWLLGSHPGLFAADAAFAMVHAWCQSYGMRVPTLKELMTLVDPTHANPAVNPKLVGMTSDVYWTSSPDISIPGFTGNWQGLMADGFGTDLGPTAANVACVR